VTNLWKAEEMYIDNPLAEIFTEPLLKAKKGVVDLPQRPGMGLTLDKKKIAKYRLT
jgi:L-alanine-DL-glutamate epimerase-like enolase superfamily enzyme